MNREEKLEFIKQNHPELYTLLETNVKGFVENIWDNESLSLYNAWVAFYCGQRMNGDLMNKLLI